MKKLLPFFFIPVFFLFLTITSCKDKKPKEPADNNTSASKFPADTVVTTIARINEIKDGGIEIFFNERQAPYLINPVDANFKELSTTLREAFASKKPVKLISAISGKISTLTGPSPDETAIYLEWYKRNLTDVDTPRLLEMKRIDTISFNRADILQWKAFRLCTMTIPDLVTAQSIFNFCKQQMCIIGPTQIIPCIPFSYVRDGCFARAHKMRYIIETRYKYCSEKVFSFGNLDVNAGLWGGCCVGWWYHVAPLVRVMVKGQVLCYVIDPSMFTGPVLLSTWLSAQGNTTCDASSAVTSYSIQPSSAYTPSGYPPNTTYTTDPGYSLTNSALIFYSGLGPTCNN